MCDHAGIEIKGLKKCFGEQTVLSDINLSMEKGKIYGLVGRNGSGKTVLMRCILGIVHPDEGYVKVNGKQIGKDVEFAPNTGFLIEEPGFFLDKSGYQNLKYLYGINNKNNKRKLMEVMESVGLGDVGRKKVGKYSMGMRQRLGIAQAVMEEPEILLLDEPMNGLDHHGVEEIRERLLSYKQNGITIVLASHNSEDINILCDKVYYMDHGTIS